MEINTVTLGDTSYKTVVVEGTTYVEMSALSKKGCSQLRSGYSIFNQIEYLISTGATLDTIKPRMIVNVKKGTVSMYLYNLRRLARDLEAPINSKMLARRVRKAGCHRLLAIIT